jgi:hypothetical protein
MGVLTEMVKEASRVKHMQRLIERLSKTKGNLPQKERVVNIARNKLYGNWTDWKSVNEADRLGELVGGAHSPKWTQPQTVLRRRLTEGTSRKLKKTKSEFVANELLRRERDAQRLSYV